MGEGFGDYFAASFFAAKKIAAHEYRDTVMSWDAVLGGDPPCVRRLDGKMTYESFDHAGADEHDNGEIWSATLWDIWKAIGRERADPIIIESHFQLDGFTTFAASCAGDSGRRTQPAPRQGRRRPETHLPAAWDRSGRIAEPVDEAVLVNAFSVAARLL